jgi:hypothetical protein
MKVFWLASFEKTSLRLNTSKNLLAHIRRQFLWTLASRFVKSMQHKNVFDNIEPWRMFSQSFTELANQKNF